MRPIVGSALALGLVVVAVPASGQEPPAPPPDGAQAPRVGADPKADPKEGGEKPAPGSTYGTGQSSGGNMGGYSYDDKPRARASTGKARAVRKHSGPVVNLPGFEQMPDGGSRVFVSLTSTVAVEEHKAKGTITYVLKNAGVRVRNNTNALVTVHFNTPVAKARLVPRGRDAHLVIDLRATSTPTWKMTEGQDKSAVLQVDFPKGEFAPPDDGGGGTELGVNSGQGGAEEKPAKPAPAKPSSGGGTKPGPTP